MSGEWLVCWCFFYILFACVGLLWIPVNIWPSNVYLKVLTVSSFLRHSQLFLFPLLFFNLFFRKGRLLYFLIFLQQFIYSFIYLSCFLNAILSYTEPTRLSFLRLTLSSLLILATRRWLKIVLNCWGDLII